MTTEVRTVATQVAQAAREHLPREILKESGRALYSPAATLLSDSLVYFLGINPGETPGGTKHHELLTVQSDLSRLAEDRITEHGYLDEEWKGYPSGQARMQKRAKQLFALLLRRIRSRGSAGLAVANAIPTRSSQVPDPADALGRTGSIFNYTVSSLETRPKAC